MASSSEQGSRDDRRRDSRYDRRRDRNDRRQRDSSRAGLLPTTPERSSPRNQRERHTSRYGPRHYDIDTDSSSHALSQGSLAKLNALNEKREDEEYGQSRYKARERPQDDYIRPQKTRTHRVDKSDRRQRRDYNDHNHYREHRSGRTGSGQYLEKGWLETYYHEPRRRGEAWSRNEDEHEKKKRRRKKIC